MHSLFQLVSVWLIFGLLLYISLYVEADEDEDEFIAAFGNNNETSGIWQAVRDIASDNEKMEKLCRRAHRQMQLGPDDDVFDRINFGPKILTFHDPEERKTRFPILIDTVTYGVARMPKNLMFFTKGTRSGCIYYMMQWDGVGKTFRMGLPACGVHVPV